MKKRLIMALLLVGLMVVVYQNGIGIGRTFAKKEISNALNEIDDEINEAREDSKGKRVPVGYRYLDKYAFAPDEGFKDRKNTIFWQDFNEEYESILGLPPRVRYRIAICLQDSLQDYFLLQDSDALISGPDKGIYCMFYDERTIDMKEEELEQLFFQNGYELSICKGKCGEYQVRFLQYREKDSYFLYPEHIIMQTWDDSHIYVQEITGPMPRKVMDFIGVDDRKNPLVIVHSTSRTRDYILEEELSYWEFNGNFWSLTSVDLEIEYIQNVFGEESEVGNTEDLNPIYYPDGIAFRTMVQHTSSSKVTLYLKLYGMEELEKNQSFQFKLVQESLALVDLDLYPMGWVKFKIK